MFVLVPADFGRLAIEAGDRRGKENIAHGLFYE